MKIEQLGIDIYFYPVTVEFEQHLKSKFKDLGSEEERAVEIVFQRILGSDGERIFKTEEDKEFIRKKIPTSVMTKIILAMQGVTFENAKKNSKRTRT